MKRRLAVAMMALFLWMTVGCAQALLSASATDRQEQTIPLEQGGTLSLENVNGDVTVRAVEGHSVHLVAVKRARALDESKAREGLSKLTVAVESSPTAISITTRYPSNPSGMLFGAGVYLAVDYTIEVPRGTKVKLSGVNGSMDVDAPGSEVACEATNGTIRVEGAAVLSATTVNGRIRFAADQVGDVSSTNGSVEGSLLGLAPGAGHVETVNGHVALAIPSKAALRIEAENVNGSIRSGLPGLAAEKHSLSGNLNGGGATLTVETVNGGIEIKSAS